MGVRVKYCADRRPSILRNTLTTETSDQSCAYRLSGSPSTLDMKLDISPMQQCRVQFDIKWRGRTAADSSPATLQLLKQARLFA